MKTKYNVKLLNGSKQEVTYEGIETVTLPDADSDGVKKFTAGEPLDDFTVTPDFSGGDQAVEAPEGNVIRSGTIVKPEGAEAKIAKGETLMGIAGEYVTPGTSKTVELDFSDEEQTAQTVTADGDERWSEVVIPKPENLVPENIAKDVEIAGVVGEAESVDIGDVINKKLTTASSDEVTYIPSAFFSGFTMLREASFPVCTTILESAFTGCSSLETAYFPQCRQIYTSAFYGANNVSFIHDLALSYVESGVFSTSNRYVEYISACRYYDDILIGLSVGASKVRESTRTLAAYLYGSTALNLGTTVLTLPNSLEYISPYAFQSQTAVKISGNCPNLKSIGRNAFYDCFYAASISISAPACTHIGDYAFAHAGTTGSYSGGLKYLYAPNASYINAGAFMSAFRSEKYPVWITLSSILSLGYGAFRGARYMCLSNKTISVLGTLPDYAFSSCYILSTKVSAASGIPAGAFYMCMSLPAVLVNNSVSGRIEAYAFMSCQKLMSLYLLGEFLSLENSYVFSSTPMALSTLTGSFGSIYVPESLYSTYLVKSYWSYYSERFEPITESDRAIIIEEWRKEIES